MRNLLVSLMLGFAFSANATDYFADSKSIVCGDIKTVIKELSTKYEEQPFWSGVADGSKYILLVNPTNKSWTMVQYDNKVACVIGAGVRANLIILPNT